MGIEVHGVEENVRSLQDFADDASKEQKTFIKIGGILVDEAKRIVPVRKHRLQGSIVAKATDTGVRVTAGNGTVEYAGVIHRRIAYLTIAQDRKENEIEDVMTDALNGLVKKHFN